MSEESTVLWEQRGAVGILTINRPKALNALKGPVMKATKGKANPAMLDELLKKLIDEG